ncbi:MAG TPA: hypothetical protein VGX70_19055 [Gemmataceae bacterium]|jgi:hypothetical protein|nr:hypothetical protein [Gemmataceae bacterium]
MKSWNFWVFLGVLIIGASLMLRAARGEQPVVMNLPAPDFEKADEWINSKPLQPKDLRGQVVALHFWTFG